MFLSSMVGHTFSFFIYFNNTDRMFTNSFSVDEQNVEVLALKRSTNIIV